MAIDLYVGSLTRYYLRDWETVGQVAAREMGMAHVTITPDDLALLKKFGKAGMLVFRYPSIGKHFLALVRKLKGGRVRPASVQAAVLLSSLSTHLLAAGRLRDTATPGLVR
ncbi:MAG: hypothetical protein AB1791_01590 [Chloroflexota bacterium]